MLCSEFPDDKKRKVIEEIFQVKSFAFYGHAEGCVMAYEIDINHYLPVHSYGYAEVITKDGIKQLVGTSYCNVATPFIRYNTEDEVESEDRQDDLLTSFSIKGGRSSEYVLDKNGKKIPLTGLIAGRHHKLFDVCSSIQVKQDVAGYATIYYVTNNDIAHVESLFDSSNVDIKFHFIEIEQPIRTISGKVKLLIK
jgi:phenylacetate-CoA ligase